MRNLRMMQVPAEALYRILSPSWYKQTREVEFAVVIVIIIVVVSEAAAGRAVEPE